MPTDEALVAQVARGDEQALAELLRRWQRPLAHFLHRRTGGRDVEDLYQEVWLRVVRAAERFDGERRFSTWLFQIALNLSRDWQRRQPRESGAASGEGDGAAPPGDAGIDVARLLARLPDGQREVVALRYLHDLSEDDVASILGIPRGTVKSRLHHAIATLNALVRGEDGE
ncbi:sigma-70 family RNA polymerase sigma factor [bacterium]|nr:sigma-70 family RNA polymerase sigma factor [bacterium]